jgi:hypothetical protein
VLVVATFISTFVACETEDESATCSCCRGRARWSRSCRTTGQAGLSPGWTGSVSHDCRTRRALTRPGYSCTGGTATLKNPFAPAQPTTRRVAERRGGLAGAVATVGADSRYRHLTSHDGLIRSESIQLYRWTIGAPRRRRPGMVGWVRDLVLDAIARLQRRMVACSSLLPCDLPRPASERGQTQVRPIAGCAAIGEHPFSRMGSRGCASA